MAQVRVGKRTQRLHEERRKMAELMQVYGCLLKPKQQEIAQAFMSGRTFSDIAREQEVSRQAIHEAARSISETLRWYEERLGLLDAPRANGASVCTNTNTVATNLRSLRDRVQTTGTIDSPDWVLSELNTNINLLEQAAAK